MLPAYLRAHSWRNWHPTTLKDNMGWSGWEKSNHQTAHDNLTTNKIKTKKNPPQKQRKAPSRPPAQLADSAVSPQPLVLSKPMTSAEFLAEQERQTQQQARRAGVEPPHEQLVDPILEAQSPGAAASAAGAQAGVKAHQTSNSLTSAAESSSPLRQSSYHANAIARPDPRPDSGAHQRHEPAEDGT
jgi:hypothetical protein